MVHGAPDASKITKSGITYPIFDIGELAVRLGSPVTWDRRGTVIGFDTFKDGLGFCQVPTPPAGVTIATDTDLWLIDGKSLKFSFANMITEEPYVNWYLPSPAQGKLGAEMAFAQEIGQSKVSLLVSHHWLTKDYYGKVIFDRVAGTLAYLKSDNTEVVFATSVTAWNLNVFVNVWKLVIDSEACEYVRFLANEHEYDLTGIALRERIISAPHNMYVKVQVYNKTLMECYFWLDRVVFTQNEP